MRRVRGIHFVGIGGIGMCGLAELLHDQGYRVTGSDLRAGVTVERLRARGIEIAIGHAEANLGARGDTDVVVYSSAVRATNPELAEAARRGLPVIRRAEMLAELMRLKEGIAVAGSHGKTTTTSLIAHVLTQAGLDPTAVIGGRLLGSAGDPTGARLGRGELLVAEADESDGSFLRLAPAVAVVTNIDPEHLDHYGHVDALDEAFATFANRVPFWGAAVVCLDDPGVQRILPRLERRVITYGRTPQAQLVASELHTHASGSEFTVRQDTRVLGRVQLPLLGEHNVANALAALAVALEQEVPFDVAREALASFGGVERRFETKGREHGVWIVDDYAHHPTEVRATLAAARLAHRGRIVAVFQPHRYTRTRDCLADFASAFHDADVVVVTEVYAAGEDKIAGADGASVADAIRQRGHRGVRFEAELEAVAANLPPALRSGDLVLTLGAGNVSSLGPRLVEALRARGDDG